MNQSTSTCKAPPRHLIVRFKDLGRWDPNSFHTIEWHWPREDMKPIGSVLKVRKEKIDRARLNFSELQLITIHFDGSIDPRKMKSGQEYSMELFGAHAGDVVVSKIDLKNGAAGIVPEAFQNVAVTGHFAVYEPDLSLVEPKYLHLVIQAKFFKMHLWRNKVGAEGRKEVKLDFFLRQEIPLPPLEVQRAIVKYLQRGQDDIASARARIEEHRAEIDKRFLADLGVEVEVQPQRPKAFFN